MKKILALILCICMALTLVACGTQKDNNADNDADKNNEVVKEAEYKLGMGVVVNMDSSKTGNAQVDATVATVVTDAEGKIVVCRIDVAQNKMNVADGAVEADKTFKTKMELGDEYGMAGKVDNNDDGVMLEWYEQTKAFEKYVEGKTAAEVEAIETQEAKGHLIAVDKALLDAGCSMQITDFISAVAAACKDEQGMSFKTAKEFTLGVAAVTEAADSKAATADEAGLAAMYTDFAATVVAEGKIIAALYDAIQPKIAINAAGEIGDKTYTATKRNLKENYNMSTYGASMDPNGDGKVNEWYIQSEIFAKHVVGMTADEVANMETAANSIGYQMSTDTELVAAGCTIQITTTKAVMAQAAKNAR